MKFSRGKQKWHKENNIKNTKWDITADVANIKENREYFKQH